MSVETVETVVVGAGQAGLAMSEHLSNCGGSHVVLERDRIAERWRTGRWDSLVANGPAWHDRFPSMEFNDVAPDDFATKDSVVNYFTAYAEMISAPVRSGVEVSKVIPNEGRPGYAVETSSGVINAHNVVAATGPFHTPVIPPLVPEKANVLQIHSADYNNPGQLPDGGVMVVGAGSSGVQIADELQRSGREVHLSVGPHDRPPRSYRGRDYVWWLGVLGKWDLATPKKGAEHITISVSGARGGHTIDFRSLAYQGITLVGMTESFNNGVIRFSDDLQQNIANGDSNYLSVLDEADAYVESNGLDLPVEPEARGIVADPPCVAEPIREVSLEQAGIGSIIWATGYTTDYSWLQVDTFDGQGKPLHHRGVSNVAGIYFLGLPWQSKRGSSFIYGVWDDAKYLAGVIEKQRNYLAYQPTSK